MFGSLTMFAAGVFASSPRRESSSGMRWSSDSRSGNAARILPEREMSASSISTPASFVNARTTGRSAWVARAGASSMRVQVIFGRDMSVRRGKGWAGAPARPANGGHKGSVTDGAMDVLRR